MVAHHPSNFEKKIHEICKQSGVAVVFTRSLPKAPISGATRWVGNNPLIQLTDRYKTNDHFWFTFYHEAGHIILHGKKEIFLEQKEYQQNPGKEQEANVFAENWLLPKEFKNDLPSTITEEIVIELAKKYNTHPAVVVGRLQRMQKVQYWFGNKFKERISLFPQ
jgi:HTH-type transcriptional regulator / antitoxin HigA